MAFPISVRGACIDIGSNTTRLLVADCDGARVAAIHQSRAFTRLGRDIAADGRFSASKVAEVGEVVADQVAQARGLGAGDVRCVATAAVRRASNAQELIRWIERRCPGLKVDVLSEEREAQLAFLGACHTLRERPDGPLGLVDVGGGSSELVVGDPDHGVSWWVSVSIGSGDLSAEFVHADPPLRSQLDRAQLKVRAAFAGIDSPRPVLAMAVGGSASSLVNLAGGVLDESALLGALKLLTEHTAGQVAADTGVDPERVRLLPAGLLILLQAARLWGQPLTLGAGGLREGVLLEAAGG